MDPGPSGTVGQWRELPVRIDTSDAFEFGRIAPRTFVLLDLVGTEDTGQLENTQRGADA